MLVEKAQEFPALFLVKEKKMQREYGSNYGSAHPGIFI